MCASSAAQPLFQFDRRPYEYKVRQLEAQLAKSKQDVLVLKADTAINSAEDREVQGRPRICEIPGASCRRSLRRRAPAPKKTCRSGQPRSLPTKRRIKEAQAEETRAQLRYTSDIDGVNTTVAAIQAELDQARYYLDNTLMVAPEDGYIMNLQVRPGMVAGDVRFGAIASFICDADRYLLANYFQENLKYVKPGQAVEVALDLYPGPDLARQGGGDLARAAAPGQMLPSGTLPNFNYVPDRSRRRASSWWRSRSTIPTS